MEWNHFNCKYNTPFFCVEAIEFSIEDEEVGKEYKQEETSNMRYGNIIKFRMSQE